MTKKDKLIIEFEYNYMPGVVKCEDMETSINLWVDSVLKQLRSMQADVYSTGLASTSIDVKTIMRKSAMGLDPTLPPPAPEPGTDSNPFKPNDVVRCPKMIEPVTDSTGKVIQPGLLITGYLRVQEVYGDFLQFKGAHWSNARYHHKQFVPVTISICGLSIKLDNDVVLKIDDYHNIDELQLAIDSTIDRYIDAGLQGISHAGTRASEEKYNGLPASQEHYVPYQKCPKCDGQGTVSKPPYLAGDVHQWSASSLSFSCDVCNGAKIIPMFKQPI